MIPLSITPSIASFDIYCSSYRSLECRDLKKIYSEPTKGLFRQYSCIHVFKSCNQKPSYHIQLTALTKYSVMLKLFSFWYSSIPKLVFQPVGWAKCKCLVNVEGCRRYWVKCTCFTRDSSVCVLYNIYCTTTGLTLWHVDLWFCTQICWITPAPILLCHVKLMRLHEEINSTSDSP